MRVLEIDLGHTSYPVILGWEILSAVETVKGFADVVKGRELFIVSDSNVWPLYGEKLQKSLIDAGAKIKGKSIFEAGEENKNVGTVASIWDDMVDAEVDRSSMVVALGGGVTGDMAGFAAAAYMRGVDFVQVPTTLLAMVDSSVGGKTGVDHPRGKNLIGAFHQPKAVLADLGLLGTLPRREVLSGLAEVIKAGILADEELFDLLEKAGPSLVDDKELLTEAVARAVKVKAKVVAADEKEGGERALLNLGHTFGHAVEAAAGYARYTHGEAVAMGIAFATNLALAMGEIKESVAKRIINLLVDWGYELKPAGISAEEIKAAIKHDKKSSGGSVKWVLPREIGRARWGVLIDEKILDAELKKGIG